SLVKNSEYSVPIYGLPRDRVVLKLRDFDASLPNRTLVGRIVGQRIQPYYTQAEINQGAIAGKAEVLVWVKHLVDRLFLEIQGSGHIMLENGKSVYLGYAGGNGAPYTPVGRVLVERKLIPRDAVSMQRIRAYFEAHPNESESIINENHSAVFFQTQAHGDALGSQGVALTPGYSMAVDNHWVPMGCPIWLKTTRPAAYRDKTREFTRLLIAQDTGGAIKGPVRGDVFWGNSDKASAIAGKMKNTGQYWLLLPKSLVKP
ncbi:MAG: hypothetical protein B7X00_01080, partial [Legionella sp. 21-45-4]